MASQREADDAYRLAFADDDFMLSKNLLPVRIQLELLKAELVQQEHGIEQTIVVFGSTRIIAPDQAQLKYEAAEQQLKVNPADSELKQQLIIAERDSP